MAKNVEPLEQVIDGIAAKIKADHIDRLKKGDCTIEYGFILSDILNNIERVSDHCSNIAVAMIEVSQNSFDTHQYLLHSLRNIERYHYDHNSSGMCGSGRCRIQEGG